MVAKPGEEAPGQNPGNDQQLENIGQLAELQKMVAMAAKGIEDRLADSLGKVIEGINSKIELNAAASAELQARAKTAFETLPALIQEHVESQMKANFTGIVEAVSQKFEEKVKAMAKGGGNSGAPGGLGIQDLLAHSDKIIGVINAWKQPTTEAAMMGQMNLIFRWHGLLSKLEKGGGSGQDVTEAIASTFKTQE